MNPCYCCGISLRTGSLAVATFEIVASIMGIFASLWSWGEVADTLRTNTLALQELNSTVKSPEVNVVTAELFVLTLDTILFSVYFILAILLVTGVRKSIVSLLQAWLVIKAILITLEIVFLILSPSFLPQDAAEPVYAMEIVSLVVCTYFFMVIYAHLNEIQNNSPSPDGTPYEKAEF